MLTKVREVTSGNSSFQKSEFDDSKVEEGE